MLLGDCREFVRFVQQRDPVIFVRRDSDLPEIEEVKAPCEHGGLYCLWNQAILPSLQRTLVAESNAGPYYTFGELPLIEFHFPLPVQPLWNGRPALLQGRVY